MTPTQRAAMERALEALNAIPLACMNTHNDVTNVRRARTNIAAALAEPAPVQEPVYWNAVLATEQVSQQPNQRLHRCGFRHERDAKAFIESELDFNGWHYTLVTLYTAQQPAPPADVPMLTPEEIDAALHVALPSLSYDSEDAFITGVRVGEKLVR